MASEFHYADYIVFSITIVISLSIGIYYACSGNRQRSNAEYFVGNRTMKILPVMVSVLVSAESSIMMLGMAAEIYIHGCMFYISLIAYMFGIFFVGYFIVPIVHPLKLTSIYEYLDLRFKSRAVRILASTLAKMITLFYMGLVLLGPALAIKAVLGFPVIGSILIVCGVSVIYTTIGGFKAVIWADVFQGVVMLIGLLAVLIKGTIETGGPSEVFRLGGEGRRLDMWDFDPDPRSRHTFFTLVFGGFTIMIGRALEQASMQRVFSVPKTPDAQKVLYIVGPLVTITMGLACFQGLVAYAYYSKLACDPLAARRITNPNQIIPLLVLDMFSSYPGMPGLYMASLCSSSLSTLSSGYGSLSAQTVKDFIEPLTYIKSEKATLIIAKLSVVLYGAISVGISVLLSSLSGSFISIVIGLLGAIAGPVTGMILLAALVPFANKKGALSGTLFGVFLTSWITAGRILSPTLINTPTLPPAPSDNCPITNSTMTPFNYTMEAIRKIDYYKHYEPKGADNIYSLSYIIIAGIGMLTALVIGIIVSWITGCNPEEAGDEIYYINVGAKTCISEKISRNCCRRSRQRNEFKLTPNQKNMPVDDTDEENREESYPGYKRPEEIDVLNQLRNEGLLDGPEVKSAGGLSYDLVDNTTVARPPARLAKLKTPGHIPTEAQIREKLEKAERRRKRKEEAVIRKLKRGNSAIEEAQKNIVAKREKLTENAKQRMENVQFNRELKVKELQEKNLKKAKHANTVRLRKDINLDELDPV